MLLTDQAKRRRRRRTSSEWVGSTANEIQITLTARPPLIDQLVGVLSVSRVTAGAHCHVLVGASHNFPVVTIEICGGRKFRENFEAQNPHPKFS
jgi:hypothetical protein